MIDKRCDFIDRDFSVQDIDAEDYKDEAKVLECNYIKPYTLRIKTNEYVGNFERELIAYVFGVLDGVQMKIHFAEDEIKKYYQEEDEFVRKHYPRDYSYDLYGYESENYWLDKFYEFFTAVDDWYQITFYQMNEESYKTLNIYFNDKISNEDYDFICKRLEKFFKYVINDEEAVLFGCDFVNCNQDVVYASTFNYCHREIKEAQDDSAKTEETNPVEKEKLNKYEEVLKLIVEKNFNIYLFKLTEKRMADASVESKTFFFNLFATSDEEILTVEEYTSIKNAIDEVSKVTA